MSKKIILIHPPLCKAAEPPAGLASLSGSLAADGIEHEIIDANLEGFLHLLYNHAAENSRRDRWTARAVQHLDRNISALRNGKIYQNESRYQRAISDISRLIAEAGKSCHVHLTPADYRDPNLTPVKKSDLLRAAEKPQANPFYPYFSARLLSALESRPSYIGFSLNYLSQALCAFAMMGFIRKQNPKQQIILGGSLATSWVNLTGKSNIFSGLVDEMVAGAGEQILLSILGGNKSSAKAPPCYRNFPQKSYLSPAVILPYSAARGCYWRQCSFCPEKTEENPYLPDLPGKVIINLRKLCLDNQAGLIHLLDNALSPALLCALAQNSPGAPWYGFTRLTGHLADEEFCRSLRQNGCIMLKLGIESGDQKVLDKLNKGIDLPTASRALKMMRRAGIASYVYLLFGTPPEDEKSAAKTLNFVVSHHDCIDYLNLAVFNLPALSAEAKNLTTASFYEGDLSLYKDFAHPLGWQRAVVRRFLEKEFKKHPAVAAILRRTPQYFTSNHAPFFVLDKVRHLIAKEMSSEKHPHL